MKLFGGSKMFVDGIEVHPNEKFLYRGMMMNNVPNLIFYAGYTNASWTLKCEITSSWSARILNHMDKVNAKQCMAFLPDDHAMKSISMMNLNSGYVQRYKDNLPLLGDKGAWAIYSFMSDFKEFLFGKVDSHAMKFE